VIPIPEQVGLCRFGRLGASITVECPEEFDVLMRQAGGTWGSGARHWLLRQNRICPVLCAPSPPRRSSRGMTGAAPSAPVTLVLRQA
jgi:hypothetical protein